MTSINEVMEKFVEYANTHDRNNYRITFYPNMSGHIENDYKNVIRYFNELYEAFDWLEQQTKGESQ
jgi:hypothetical protein